MAMDVSTKIFTRWVNQKLRVRGIVLNDATKDLADGNALVNLVEVLSEKSFGKKLADTKGMRVRQIDNVNNVLKFVWSTGVSLDIKPSAENIVNGEAKPILGLLWAIMKRYLVFTDQGDDEGKGASVSVADSLQGWFQIQLSQYRNVEIKDLTKSFHNGLALCALIHKYRPKLIPSYETLDAKAGGENLKIAFAAAEKFFGLEQYLTPDELKKLDDKGMVVYLSEYYYGVAAQRKIDKAGLRIGKLIKFTQTNDDQKARYIDGARKLRARIAELETIMADRTVDNSLERAKARLEDFFKYKTSTKGTTIDNQYLELESSFNQLAMRLAANRRPAFTPDAELTLQEIKAAMKALEQSEQTTKLHLHEELNRQVRLATLNSQHQRRFDILSSWFDAKRNYLETKETVDSVGAAQSNLSTLNALGSEAKELAGGSLVELKKLGAQLIEAKYEFSDAVQKREEQGDSFFATVDSMRAAKLLVLEDHLKREQYKQQVNGWNARHVTAGEAIQQWVTDKRNILSAKADVASISDAEVQLSLLRAFQPEKKDLQAARLPPFEKLGAQLLEAKYSTDYSTFAFEGDAAAALKARTDAVHAAFPELDQLYEVKLEVLSDDLAREKFKERLRQDNRQHNAIHAALVQWATDKKAYLEKKDDVKSVADAQLNLASLNAYEAEKKERTAGDFSALKRLGGSIVSDKYETKLSSYVFDAPQDVQAREAAVDEIWVALDGASAKKKTVLDDDLARETFRERLSQDNETHKAKHKSLFVWVANKKAYLEQKETATSVTGAHSNLGALASYEADENDTQSSDVKALKQIGAGIVSERFTSELSSFQFATPEEIAERESSIDAAFAQLRELAVAKKQVLDADLAREIRKEELRLQFVNAAADFQRWVKERVEEAASTHFGYTLPAVEAFGAVLDESDKAIADIGKNRKQADTSAIWAQLTDLGVTEIGYSNESPETIQQGWQAVEEALAKRRAAYGAELDRHKTNDQNGRDLAALVDPMAKEIEGHKATITDSKDTLANQLAFVDQRVFEAKDESRLFTIEKLQKALDDGGVANNPHSMLSALDARFMWEQYGNFLSAKKKSIEDEIQANKYRGVTQAQIDEINQQFKQFDTTGDGRLDRMEMKTCLFSLNDERPAKEIKAIMAKYEPLDDPNHINHEGFMSFMLNDLGDQDTKEEIVNSFAMVMGEKPVFLPPPPAGTEEKKETPEEKEKREKEEKERKFKSSNRIEDYMDDSHVTYFRSTAPPLDDGFDYFAWTETMFAR